jgi:hypothetical protein
LVLDEWHGAIEHLLLSNGTALAKRRAEVLRTTSALLRSAVQVIAANAQMPLFAVELLERLTGRRVLVLGSDSQPMKGRRVQIPAGFKSPDKAAEAFRCKWSALVDSGEPFLCWTSSQKAGMRNSAQTLAKAHRERVPGARVLVIDSENGEAAADLAADPDEYAKQWDAIYATPSIDSGISLQRWKPAAVIAYCGGLVTPERVVQAVARVRNPEVPVFIYTAERCPGGALRVGSGATKPDQLIAHLRAVADPLFGHLEAGDDEGAWLQAWAEIGAIRNRQRFAYRATIAGMLEAEGWELQAPEPAPDRAVVAAVTAELTAVADKARRDADLALLNAAPISDGEASELAKRTRLEPEERLQLERHRLAKRWALGSDRPTLELLKADRDGLSQRLRLGWLLVTPEAHQQLPERDRQRITALDALGRPFEPDRLRVSYGQQVLGLQALGVPQLLERFAAGETFAATDPAVLGLHLNATTHQHQLTMAAGVTPGKLATGTLRNILNAVAWNLETAGRIKTRNGERDVLKYRAEPVRLPACVDAPTLAAAWRVDLGLAPTGALFSPTQNSCWGEKCPINDSPPPRPSSWPDAPRVAVPWPFGPVPARSMPRFERPPADLLLDVEYWRDAAARCGAPSPETYPAYLVAAWTEEALEQLERHRRGADELWT